MATYFVFGNAPSIDNLLDYTGKDEKSDDLIKIEDAENKPGHFLMNINGHAVGAQIDFHRTITAIYSIDSDLEGVRLLTILIEQWSDENSVDERDIATTVLDDEMSIYLEYF
jgi:hypothetical protein